MARNEIKTVVALRPEERIILAGALFVFLAAVAVMFFGPQRRDLGALGREAGSLRAPTVESDLTDGFGRPDGPPSVVIPQPVDEGGEDDQGAGGNPSGPPKPADPTTPPEEPPGRDGVLGFLPDLPVLPPPPPLAAWLDLR